MNILFRFYIVALFCSSSLLHGMQDGRQIKKRKIEEEKKKREEEKKKLEDEKKKKQLEDTKRENEERKRKIEAMHL